MEAGAPTCPPRSFVAGDTLAWTRALQAYPAGAGWALHYALVGTAATKIIDAIADGDAFAVAVSAADSAAYVPGAYRLQEYVTNGAGERVTLGVTTLEVLPNLAATPATGADTRSDAQRMLDAVNVVLQGRAGAAEQQVTFNGRAITYMPMADLLALRSRLKLEVLYEQRALGVPDATKLHVRFA